MTTRAKNAARASVRRARCCCRCKHWRRIGAERCVLTNEPRDGLDACNQFRADKRVLEAEKENVSGD